MPVATVTLPDGRTMKLGRVPPLTRPQCPLFIDHFDAEAAQPPPPMVDYASKAIAALHQVDMNATLGCCVISGKMHQIGLWTGNDTGTPALASDNEVISQYHAICGPGDNGCQITAVLDHFRSKGLTCGGQIHWIDGYVLVDSTNKLEVQVALYLFGSLTLGFNLPGAWQQSARPGFLWDDTSSPSVGGHDICVVGYDNIGVQVCTWGMLGTITWMALANKRIFEETYAALARDWYGNDQLAPCGVNAETLKADLIKLGGGMIPPLPDPGPPGPPPPPPPPPVHLPPTAAQIKTVVDAAILAGLRATLKHFGTSRLFPPAMVLGAALPVVSTAANQAIDTAFSA